MKINVILGHAVPFPPSKGGGIEALYDVLTKEWCRRGHDVTIISNSNSVDLIGKSKRDNSNRKIFYEKGYTWKKYKILNIICGILWTVRIMRKLPKADVTLFNSNGAFIASLFPSNASGLKISTIHRTPNKLIKLYSKFDRVYAGSRSVIKQALEIKPTLCNLKPIYNCVDVSALEYKCPEISGGLNVLYVGRFVKDKGLRSLIHGFTLFLNQLPEDQQKKHTLSLLGPTSAEEGADEHFLRSMTDFISKSGYKNQIKILGPEYDKTRLRTIIHQHNVACVPTITGETFSIAVLELMALGLPCIVSDFPPMLEAVNDGETGYVVIRDDETSMMQVLNKCNQDVEKLTHISRKARLQVVNRFSVEAVATEYLTDFLELDAQKI